MKIKFIAQAQEKGCGYACVKMLLTHHGLRNADLLPEPIRKGEAPSLGEIRAYALSCGLSLTAYKFPDLKGLASKAPLLLLWSEQVRSHLVVLLSLKRGRCFLLDPAVGKRVLPVEEASSHYAGVCLLDEGYSPRLLPPKKRSRIIPFSELVLLCLFPFAESCLILSAFSFFQEGALFWIPLVLFLASALLALAKELFLLSRMRKFDERYAEGLLAEESEERKERLRHYSSYKKASFLFACGLPSSFFAFALGACLLSYNDPLFAYCFAACAILLGLEEFFLEPVFEKKKRKAAEEEALFLALPEEKEEKKKRLNGLFALSYGYAEQQGCKKVALLALSAGAAMVCMLLGTVSLNRFLFLFFGMAYLLKLEDDCFQGASYSQEASFEAPYFRLHFLKSE